MRAQRWGVATTVALAVVAASLVPASAASGGSLPGGADKLLHAVGYAALSFSVAVALRARTGRALAAVVLVVAALGAGVEVVQPTVGRTASLLDAAANLGGATAGALLRHLVATREADTLAD
ncbi:hypothetical protein [Halobacterium wangiae]|uniref:hypothetical protein n=1 Tax=Halobacterium wangiae TaxID=2902623 RepID=UPI001E559C35|nr:hypothetical protein [Halobacterium wangiae]